MCGIGIGPWACPRCHGALGSARGALRCRACAARYPVRGGLADFGLDEALGANARRQRAEWDAMSEQYGAVLARLPAARFRPIDAPLLALARGDVLEVGCGDGRLLARVAAAASAGAIVGVDVAPGMARRAAARGFEVAVAPAERLPLPDGSVDAVLSGYYALRYADLELALAEVARVLRPGGRLGFTLLGRRATALRGRLAGLRLLGSASSRWTGALSLLGRLDMTMPNDVRDADELRGQLGRHGLRLDRLLGTVSLPLLPGAALPYLRGGAAARWGYDVVAVATRT
jgi:SAM-dependent methyltransferase